MATIPPRRLPLLYADIRTIYIGVFGITAFGNVPLNDTLDKFDILHAGKEAMAEMRRNFEDPWVKLHTIRTIAAVLAFICGLIGLYQAANEQ